jgi:hypothetical protein
MLANPVRGQVAVKSSAFGDLVFVLSFAVQKACEAKFSRRFLDLAEDLDEMLSTDIAWIFWAGFQPAQPALTEENVEALIDEIGVLAMYKILGEAVRAAFDPGDLADPPARPQKARRTQGR